MAVLEGNSLETQALLKAVAEELKLPLLQIARSSEMVGVADVSAEEVLHGIRHNANSALELIDSYMLGLQLAEQQQMLKLEPVSAASIMYDTAHKLSQVAKNYEVDLVLELKAIHGPVMSNPAGLSAALLSLGTAFVEAQPQGDKRQTITLAAYRTSSGLAAGMYSQTCDISAAQLGAASRFYGKMRQPFGQFSATSAAGIFVAQQILQAMAAQLKVARHNKQVGIAAILQPSRQLQLV